jgi:hypothetical protein
MPATNLETAVLELRQYTLHPDMRDSLVELFDRYFVEGQEACGMSIPGQFRDLENPDRFVWLRGFADMDARKAALERFYGGPVWTAHRAAANATMVDFSDVLLLKPAWAGSDFKLDRNDRPANGSVARPRSAISARITHVAAPALADFSRRFREEQEADKSLIAAYMTEDSPNSFPGLPIRDDSVFVSFYDESASAPVAASSDRAGDTWLRLAPTARSLLGGPLSRDAGISAEADFQRDDAEDKEQRHGIGQYNRQRADGQTVKHP